MSDTLTINSLTSLAEAITRLDAEWREHRYLEIEIKRKAGQRTLSQNRALHLFLAQLCEVLNEAGLDMRTVLKQDVEIPWTVGSAKEHLWRPIQKALTEKRSTTEITTVEPTIIHETLCRHLASKLGVACPPWPSRERRAA
jgi:hypothetical protein